MLKKKAQSILEYVIVLTAIIAGVILVASQFLQPRVQSSLDHVSSEMEQAVRRINY